MVKINKFEKGNKRSNATLVAAALVVTAATGFGTYASTDPSDKNIKQNRAPFMEELTTEQKAGIDQARELFQTGDTEGAKAILDNLQLEDMEWRFHVGQKMKLEAKDFMKNLTEEQQEGLETARQLFEDEKPDEAQALLEKLGIELPAKFEMKLELSPDQKEALQEARELKEAGDEEGAKSILEKAGINLPGKEFKFHLKMSKEVLSAIEAGDFEAWKKAITAENPDDKLIEEIDEAKFESMVKIHAAMEADDFETVKKLAEEAGLDKTFLKGPFGGGGMKFMKDLTEEEKLKIEEAHTMMKAGNKDGAEAIFEELGLPMAGNFMFHEELTEEEKTRLKEAKELMTSGNEEQAKAIFDELGLEPPMQGLILNKMHNLTDEQKAGLEKAQELRNAGDEEGAKTLMNSLNIPKPKDRMMMWFENEEA